MYERQALFGLQAESMLIGVAVALPEQNHFAPKGLHSIDFDLRRRGWHHDDCPCVQLPRAHGHPLGVISSRRTDHSLAQLFCREVCHLVVRTAQLEAEHGLLVFPL